MSNKRVLVGSALLLAALIAVGCKASRSGHAAASAPAQKAVVVMAGNGGGIVVYLPADDQGHVTAMAGGGGQVCSECMDASKTYFLTGRLESHCPVCGGLRTAVSHEFSSMGHN